MKDKSLKRVLGLGDAVGVGLGAIIGAGIFVVTGVAAGVAGPAFLVGLLIAGMVASFNGLSSAQLAAVYPQSGGTYEYGYRLMGPAWGFSAGWMFLISKLSAAGVVAIGFGSYFHQLLPLLDPLYYSVMAVVLLTLANLMGVQKAGFINILIVAVTLLGSFDFVVRAATFTILLYYGITNLSAIKQPANEHIYGRIIPWLGLAGCIAMSISLPLSVIASGLILLATGFLLRRIPRIN